MKKLIANTLLVFLFILAINVGIQFVMWTQAENTANGIAWGLSPLSWNELRAQYGVGQTFVPDLWPFDNRSIWTGKNLWTGK